MLSQEHPKKLFLLDAYALIFRAYYAFVNAPRINAKGMNTGAMLGFTNTLLEIIQKEKPTHLAVVFDAPEQTLREIDYEAYKANRGETPEDIKIAVPWIYRIIEAFNIPTMQAAGYEADDVIGTLAKKAEKHGFVTYMMTSDKDYGQLVSDHIFIYRPGIAKNPPQVLGVKEVCEKFGISRVEQVIDILGMMGDAVDNIPGIPGIGEKTATKLVNQFGSLEGLLANTDQLKGKQKENVENFAEQGRLSKKLATILLDAPCEIDEEALRLKEWNKEALREIFAELEFRTLAKRWLGEEVIENTDPVQGSLFSDDELSVEKNEESTIALKTIHDVEHSYHLVQSDEDIQQLIGRLKDAAVFSFDTETTDIEPINADLVGMSFSIQPHEAYYVPVPRDTQMARQLVAQFQPIFDDTSKRLIAQNFKYDYKMLCKYGIDVRNQLFDTMVAHYLINPDGKHNMDYLSEVYLGYSPIAIETLIGKKGKNQGTMADLNPEEIKDYAAEDADVTLQLHEVLDQQVEQAEVRTLLNEVEVPLITVLGDMELEGVQVDEAFLRNYSNTLAEDIAQLENEIHSLAGEQFNIDSPKQLGIVLFEHLKITQEVKKTRTGQYATGEDVLSKYQHSHPIIAKVLDYREVRKLKSTYVDSIPELINPRTGRVHTNYMQTIVATGRLSSNNPNLQNIPVRTPRGQEIRKAFVARGEGYRVLSADYSQVELRIIAALSNDENMCEAFMHGEDIHRATASKVFGVPLESVDRTMRSKAKAVNFGIIYGQGAFGLAQNLGIPRAEAREIIDAYFAQFPRLKAYQQENIAFAREHGYVSTVLGRKRYLADINSAKAVVRGFAERNAINAPIQGSAADIIKIAMINIQREIKSRHLKSRMIMQVHDELVFDMWQEEEVLLRQLINEKMTGAVSLRIPLVVDINTGANWLEAH